MSGEIEKIDSIKNMAVFSDFNWSSSVRDKDNNIASFKRINILYGRNYSGKTTLSRIFRAMETGYISDKYTRPEFQVSFNGGANITQNSLTEHDQVIRVFNEDFVKDNLRFIVDDEHTINSFAILGEDNAKLEQEIDQHYVDLGKEDDKSGLIGKQIETSVAYQSAKRNHDDKFNDLENKLKDKANKAGTGIKHNKAFGDANYNIVSIKKDITAVSKDTYTQITPEQAGKYHELLKEDPKPEISGSSVFNLKYSSLITKVKDLVEKKIETSEPIQELLNDAVLETWVRKGREQHEGKRSECAFCGNDLPSDLWGKLDKHFNQQSESLRTEIEALLKLIETEKTRIPNLLKIKISDFYSNFGSDLEALEEKFTTQSTAYCEALEAIKTQLEERESDIFTSLSFSAPTSAEQDLDGTRNSYENLRTESNDFTESLSTQQLNAKSALCLHEVFTFITDIKYSDECTAVEGLNATMDTAEQTKNEAQAKVSEKKDDISELKAQLEDESIGADRVNHYLNNFFGDQSLSLKAIESTSDDGAKIYRFEVTRDGKKAFHLSEGECSLIAFCYFMAKLQDIDTDGLQPIIWIDDPVSSLDANHIFFVYSLINAEIITPEEYEEDGEIKERQRFKQIFLSTHNLDFLKYLKRLPGARNNNKSQYFLINREDKESTIYLMPDYLKEYVTEFNYLFDHIYKCASIEIPNDDNYTTFYNFGNNARKFFEIYLYYKYPDNGKIEDKLCLFFGDEKIPAILTGRINNEYSHLSGCFERGALPVEVSEMTTAAKYILKNIRDNDPPQYSSLLKSIDVDEESSIELDN